MITLILCIFLFATAIGFTTYGPAFLKPKLSGPILAFFALLPLCANFVETVPAGHVKVSTLFGKVVNEPYEEGLHFVNPLYSFHTFDLRQKTLKETASVPSQDKLNTTMDVSIQYRTIGSMTPDILKNTGSTEDLLNVHLTPKLRSILREQSKGIEQSQDFFLDHVQSNLQVNLKSGLSEYLQPKGILIDSVLIRNIDLPLIIKQAIEETKRREQEVIKQKAELERFAMEQEQKVKQAESELKAAKLEAEKIKALADAEAYQIDVVNNQLAKSANYIKLKQVEQWNGVLPVYAGGDNVPMIDLRK